MKCPNCGQEVGEDTKFCPECGQRIVREEEPRAPTGFGGEAKKGFTPEERQKYIDELKASIEEQKRIRENQKRAASTKRVRKQNGTATRKPRLKLQSSLSKLPKVSDSFLRHITGHHLEKNEWMPCPRCGESKVEPPAGVLAGVLGGVFGIGCLILVLAVVGAILAVIFFPLAAVVVIVGLIAIPFMPLIGAALGLGYKCKSCGYSWTFADADKYKKSID